MTEQILGITFGLLFPAILGYGIIILIFGRPLFNPLMTLAIGYGLGLGVITQWMLFLLVIHLALDIRHVYIPLCIVLTILLLFLRHSKHSIMVSDAAPPPIKNNTLQKFLFIYAIFYIIYQIYFIFWNALNLPVYTYDGFFDIAIKSKYFFYNGQISGLSLFPASSSYPLHVELSMTWMALNIHAWDDQTIKIIFPAIFLCYLIVHYYFLEYFTDRWWAMIGTALFCSANFVSYQATIEYRSIFFLYYNTLPILILLFWYKERHDGFLWLAGLLAGFSTFTKLEATGHCLIYIILLWLILKQLKSSTTEKFQKFIKFLLPIMVIYFFFYSIKRTLHLPFLEGRLVLSGAADHFDRLKHIIINLFVNFYFTNNWNILWFVLYISLIKNIQNIKECFISQMLIMALAMYIGLYAAVGLLTDSYKIIFIDANLSRTILHFFPLVPLVIILTNYGHSKSRMHS